MHFLGLFILLAAFFISSSPAQALPPAHSGKLSSAYLGFRYSSIYQKRGVIIYRDFQIDPALSLFFFDDSVAFLGESIDYQKFIFNDQIRFRTRLVAVGDDPLFPAYESVKKNNPDRKTTYEWSNGFDFYFPGYNDDYQSEIEFTFSKDISAHWGHYLNLVGKTKLFDFTVLNTLVEPNLVATVGWGDKPHNQHFYGPSDTSSSLTDISYGVWLAFPKKADRHYAILQLMRFSVVGDSHRNAEYALNRNEGFLLSLIASYPILD